MQKVHQPVLCRTSRCTSRKDAAHGGIQGCARNAAEARTDFRPSGPVRAGLAY